MALDIEQINQVVSSFAEKSKNWERNKNKRKADKHKGMDVPKYPEYWDGYNFAAQMYEAILPHAYPNIFPEHLFELRAPNQTEEQEKWIRNNYRPITLTVFEDFKSTITRIFSDENWHIKYKPELEDRFGEETFEQYVNSQIEIFGSIEMYFKSLLVTLKLIDANGIVATYPNEFPTITNEQGEQIFSNELLKPLPHYFNCMNIVGKESDQYYLVKTPMKSYVTEADRKVKDGVVLFLFDDQNIWKIDQVGKKSDFKFSEPELYYNHNLGYVPADELKGTPLLTKSHTLVFQSPFISSVALLDQVLLDNSYLSMSKASVAFPFMVALGETCTFAMNGSICSDGKIAYNDTFIDCPSCGGAGIRGRFSPSGVLLIRPGNDFSQGDTGLSGDYVKFVSPPMDTLKFLREEIDAHLLKARQVIHINNADQQIQGNEAQTATGSLNKLRSMYAFIKPISDQTFSIWEFTLNVIGQMRYGEFYGGIDFTYPISFEITTPADYLAIISEGIAAGVPPSVTYTNVYNYIRAINYTDSQATAMFELIMRADELFMLNTADIALRISNGTVEAWQDVLHYAAPQLVSELLSTFEPTNEFANFFELPIDEQVLRLNDLAKSKVGTNNDPLNNAANDLLNGIN